MKASDIEPGCTFAVKGGMKRNIVKIDGQEVFYTEGNFPKIKKCKMVIMQRLCLCEVTEI